jgi:hypothetical protein
MQDHHFVRRDLPRRLAGGCLAALILLRSACGVWSATNDITQCTETVLRNALGKGGVARFRCSSTIPLTNTIEITTNVVLDGTAQAVILSGGNGVRLFNVHTGVQFTLLGLTLSAGKDAGADGTNGAPAGNGGGGAIFNDGGSVVASNCVFSGNAASGGNGANGIVRLNGRGDDGSDGGFAGGGAIYNLGGALSLTNCVFSGNSATAGTGGSGATAGAGSNDGGNGANGGQASGGAIFNTAGGTVTLYDCTFGSNRVAGAVAGAGGDGSGLGANGSNGSPGRADGGGIFNDGGTITVLFTTFSNNSAAGANGADGRAGAGDGDGSEGVNGSAADGGAILNVAGTLTVTNCTFAGNSVTGGDGGDGGDGGNGGFGGDGGNGGGGGEGGGGAIHNSVGGFVTVINCTFSANGAAGGAGGSGGAAGNSFTHTGDPGSAGASSGGSVANGTGVFILKNTVLAYNTSGGEAAGAVTDAGHNLSFDTSIFPTAPTSYHGEDPGLGNLANNGGPTFTIAILTAESRAIDAGDAAACLPVDQRHAARVGICDIGAFESTNLFALTIARQADNQLLFSWPGSGARVLQTATNLSPPIWVDLLTNSLPGNQYVITNTFEDARRFFRLRQ